MKTIVMMSALLAGWLLVEGASGASNLEISYRDTLLAGDVAEARRLVDREKAPPVSVADASSAMEKLLPGRIHLRGEQASLVARQRIATFDGISSRARAMIFGEFFWEAFRASLADAIAHEVQEDLRPMVVAGFYESLLNEYAVAWEMREGDGGALRQDCLSYGMESVEPCLKVMFVHAFARRAEVDIELAAVAFAYLPQPSR